MHTGRGRAEFPRGLNQDVYRLDWVEADGRLVRGEAVKGFRPLRVTRDDRRRVREGRGGARRGSASMGSRAPRRPPEVDVPDRFPPVRLGRVWVTWDGRAIVERHQHLEEEEPLFDLFDAEGRRTGSFRLPGGREIIGTGPSGVYAVRRDELDFLWLELYRLPGPAGDPILRPREGPRPAP